MPPSPDHDPTELLADARWMRTLALRLLRGDAHGVDDLVQDAWVVALQRDEPPTRAWLAGVLRNLARLRWRTRERREAREETAARTREVPSPEALTSKLETQRALAEALLRVREPYREALLLRYHEGLEPQDIAVHLGVSGSTVRSRLLRGLGLLREELDADHGGDGRAWALALVPLARQAASTTPAAATPGALAPIAAGVAVVALGLVALAVRPDEAPREGRRTALAPSPDVASTEDLAPPASPRPRRPLPGAASPPESAAAAPPLRGRVLSAEGQPLPDVGVGLLADRWAPLDARPADVVRTNGEGRFAWPVPASGGVLRVADDDWTTLLDCTVWPDRALPERTLVAAPTRHLEVVVVDERGAPVAGALLRHALPPGFRARFPHSLAAVNVAAHDVASDVLGQARLARLPRVAGASLEVRAAGFVSEEVPLDAVPDALLHVELARTPAGVDPLQGLVLDGFGRPIAGASVRAAGASARSDGAGRFRLDDLPASGPLTLRAAGPGFAPGSQPVAMDERAAEVVVRLGVRARSLAGRVVDADGDPVAGALVWPAAPTPFGRNEEGGPLYAESLALPAEPFPWPEAVTDDAGRFRLEGLVSDEVTLAIRAPGRAPRRDFRAFTTEREVTLRLADDAPPAPLRGVVCDAGGAPVAGATVGFELTLMPLPEVPGEAPPIPDDARQRIHHVHSRRAFAIDPGRECLRELGAHVARTDEAGRFELPAVTAGGERFLRITGRAIVPCEVTLREGQREVEVVVARRCRLQVRREAGDPAFDGAHVVDDAGRALPLVEELGDWTTTRQHLAVPGDLSAWVAAPARAVELVFERDGVEVGRCPLRQGPGGVLERAGAVRVSGE